MSDFPPEAGIFFTGIDGLNHDIYPAISAAVTPSLKQEGKVVVITGAGRGIGRSMALQYAHAGVASINLVARTVTQLDAVSLEINSINSSIRVRKFAIDVSKEDQVSSLADTITQEEGRLDVLINNAGVSEPWVPIEDSVPGQWWNTFEVNLKGTYLFVRFFLRLLLATAEKRKTVVDIVNISSIGAHLKMEGATAYQISKLAVARFTEHLDFEYAARGINATSVHPGGVLTDMGAQDERIRPFLVDTPELCGGFVVWLTAGKRTWLGGRYLAATWDVEKLEAKKDEIVAGDQLKQKMVV